MVRTTRNIAFVIFAAALAVTTAVIAQTPPAGGAKPAQPPNPNSWDIPENAKAEVNPVAASPTVLESAKTLYAKHCESCHGGGGKGDGPDADEDSPPEDLTDPSRAARNPDGVMFYKIWNGRKKPKMPAMNAELKKDEVWALVHYTKSLRKAP